MTPPRHTLPQRHPNAPPRPADSEPIAEAAPAAGTDADAQAAPASPAPAGVAAAILAAQEGAHAPPPGAPQQHLKGPMATIERLIATATRLLDMVEAECSEMAQGKTDLVRLNQAEKQQLSDAYEADMGYLRANPPAKDDRDEVRIEHLKLLAARLAKSIETHMKLSQTAIQVTNRMIAKIREDVAAYDGAGLRYNASGSSGVDKQAPHGRVTPVAINREA